MVKTKENTKLVLGKDVLVPMYVLVAAISLTFMFTGWLGHQTFAQTNTAKAVLKLEKQQNILYYICRKIERIDYAVTGIPPLDDPCDPRNYK